MKKIKIISLSIMILLSLSSCQNINEQIGDNSQDSIDADINNQEWYYENLRKLCKTDVMWWCCVASVNEMEKWKHLLAKDWKCPEWFKSNLFRCIDSHTWCEKQDY